MTSNVTRSESWAALFNALETNAPVSDKLLQNFVGDPSNQVQTGFTTGLTSVIDSKAKIDVVDGYLAAQWLLFKTNLPESTAQIMGKKAEELLAGMNPDQRERAEDLLETALVFC